MEETGRKPTSQKRNLGGELQLLGWTQEQLTQRLKGDQEKPDFARRLRQETTMTLQWGAQRSPMGSWGYVSNLLNEKRAEAL